MIVYVIMKADWQDCRYCTYGGDPEEISLFGVFNNEKSAIEKIDNLAKKDTTGVLRNIMVFRKLISNKAKMLKVGYTRKW